jgi:hypothetical protein
MKQEKDLEGKGTHKKKKEKKKKERRKQPVIESSPSSAGPCLRRVSIHSTVPRENRRITWLIKGTARAERFGRYATKEHEDLEALIGGNRTGISKASRIDQYLADSMQLRRNAKDVKKSRKEKGSTAALCLQYHPALLDCFAIHGKTLSEGARTWM